MSYYQISFPCLAENLCHIKLPLKFYDDSNSYLVSHYIRSTNGEDDEVAADNEIHNLTDILEKNNVPYELSNRGMAVDARSNFRTFFYPHFPKGSNGTLKMTVDYLAHLQELYDSKEPNHDLLWDMYWEAAESGIKNACCEGRISRKDANQLFRRYGLFD